MTALLMTTASSHQKSTRRGGNYKRGGGDDDDQYDEDDDKEDGKTNNDDDKDDRKLPANTYHKRGKMNDNDDDDDDDDTDVGDNDDNRKLPPANPLYACAAKKPVHYTSDSDSGDIYDARDPTYRPSRINDDDSDNYANNPDLDLSDDEDIHQKKSGRKRNPDGPTVRVKGTVSDHDHEVAKKLRKQFNDQQQYKRAKNTGSKILPDSEVVFTGVRDKTLRPMSQVKAYRLSAGHTFPDKDVLILSIGGALVLFFARERPSDDD